MPILLGLERDRFTLEIEVKLKAARRDALAQLVAKEAKLVQERAGSDEILEHLNKIVEARRADVAALEAGPGSKGGRRTEC